MVIKKTPIHYIGQNAAYSDGVPLYSGKPFSKIYMCLWVQNLSSYKKNSASAVTNKLFFG
jgi:hypothetical protein